MTPESPHDPPRPEPPSTPAIEAFCQYLRLLELGQEVDWAEFRDEHAEVAAELERLLSEYERVTAILDSLAPAASFSARLRAHYGDSVDPGISLSDERRTGSSAEGGTTRGSTTTSGVLQRLSAQSPETRRYEARREIARGGMGAILEVWDAELRRTLAMKVVLTGRDSKDEDDDSEERAERRLSRFLEEAQITGQLDHPGIVPVHDIGIDDKGHVFFTMQLVDGLDLRKVFELARLERDGWTSRRVVGVLIRVCEAMAYAHSKGVVHRDLKPANIMVGSFGEAFVMDWGLAKVVGSAAEAAPAEKEKPGTTKAGGRVKTDRSDSDTGTDAALKTLDGDVVGTPAYMSPEQARGRLAEIGPRSDVYSIGAMLYHLLSGHMPYEPLGEKVAAHTILEAVRTGPPWPLQQLNPEVDSELAAICTKAMERDPDQRYAEVMDLGEDLRAWVEGRGVEAYTSGVLYETRKWMERNKATTGAILALIGLALVSVLLFIWQQQVNVSNLKEERRVAQKAISDREIAEASLTQKLKELSENEQKLTLEAARAQRAREEALEEERRAKRATERANSSAEMARQSEQQAVSAAYRSHINAAAYSLRLSAIDEARAHLDECAPSLRGWEWYHLRLATDASVGEPIVQDRGVSELEVNADGSEILSYGFGLPARVWDSATRHRVSELEAVASITPFNLGTRTRGVSCAIHPLRDMVILSDPSTPYAQLFNTTTGQALLSYKPKDEDGQVISGVEISVDGSWVVTISRQGVARKHELFGGEEVLSFRYLRGGAGRQAGELTCLALSPDGAFAIAGAADGRAVIWDLETGEELQRLEGHTVGSKINDVAVSADSRRALTACDDGSVGVWDVSSGTLLAMMHGHSGPVHAALFSEDGRQVVTGGEDLTIRTWDAINGRQRRVLHGHDQPVQALASLRDTRHVVSASLDSTVRVWDLGWEPSVTEAFARSSLAAITFAPGGRELYAVPLQGAELHRIDLDTGRELELGPDATLESEAPLTYLSARVSPDGDTLALGYGDRSFELRDAGTGELVRRLEGLDSGARYLSFSDDSRFLLVAGQGKRALVLDLQEERPDVVIGSDQQLSGRMRALRGADLSPDGSRVATVDIDGDLRLWDARTGAFLDARRETHDSSLTEVQFSPDGQRVATAAKDRLVRVWRSADMREPELELGGHADAVFCVAFSPDGTRLVTGDRSGEVRMWSTTSGEPLVELMGLEGAVQDLEFSPDGTRLAGCGVSTGVRVWESGRAEERYAHREFELLLEQDATELVAGLFVALHSPSLVETAVEGDADLGPELRVRALQRLDSLRNDVRYCDSVIAPVLLSGEGRAHEYKQIFGWLQEHQLAHAEDERVLGLRGAVELRMGEPDQALASFAALRDGVECGPRVDLFACLAHAELGRTDRARERLSAARAKLQSASSWEREALAGLLAEAVSEFDQDMGG